MLEAVVDLLTKRRVVMNWPTQSIYTTRSNSPLVNNEGWIYNSEDCKMISCSLLRLKSV